MRLLGNGYMSYYGTMQSNIYKVNDMYKIHRNNMDTALHISATLAAAYMSRSSHRIYETY